MKIALVSPYDFAYPGGVANHISCLERNLTARGHDIRVIAPASRVIPDFGERFIPVGRPRSVPVSGSIARITISPWLSKQVNAILAREKFDIIHLHEPLMPMLCTTILRLADAPTVGTFHAFGAKPWYDLVTPLGKFYLKKWFKRLDWRIAVSEPAMKYTSKFFPAEYSIIPNGVDPRHFCPDVSPMPQFNCGKKNILFVGRLEKRKGLGYLLDAYRQVKQTFPESRLIVAGPGTRLHKRYEKQIRRDGIQDVVFTGHVDYEDLPRYYKSADVFCSPAVGRESFGIILLEAMAAGKPIVASNIEGYASVVTDGAEAILTPPRDTKKLAGAILSLMTNETLCREMGERGRLKALEYDWASITQRVLDCYTNVLNGRNGKAS